MTETGRAIATDAVRSVVVLRALQLGDLLCSVPAFRALRAAFPEAHISLIGLSWARELIRRLPGYVDELIEFPGFPGIDEAPFDPRKLARFLTGMQARSTDLAVQMHGSGLSSNPFIVMLGARHTVGQYPPGGWVPDPEAFMEYPGHASEIRRCLRALEPLGIATQGEHLEFIVTEADAEELESIPELRPALDGPFVCIHPGARHAIRRWPAERFAAVGRSLADAGWRIVVTGSRDEAPVTGTVAAAIGDQAIDTGGRTSLGALAALIGRARLLVANDTGVAHLADALDTPSVIVFTHTDPARWAAADRSLHRVVATRARSSACAHRGGAHRCLSDACTIRERSGVAPVHDEIPVDAVIAEADSLLRAEANRVA
jgi:ADP-heptose:LPS heptosyltransferase